MMAAILKQVLPVKSILDRQFIYTPSHATDIRKNARIAQVIAANKSKRERRA